MASTDFVKFPIFRNMAQRNAAEDSLGYFFCKVATAKFFDILDLAEQLSIAIYKNRKQSKVRDNTLVDGTVLKTGEKNADRQAEQSPILQSISKTGTRSVMLRTGKKTPNGNNKMVSFLFPSFATNAVISDALGTIIPATKLKADPTQADAFNYFISEGGKRYPIITKGEADADTSSSVPASRTAADQLLKLIDAQNESKTAN